MEGTLAVVGDRVQLPGDDQHRQRGVDAVGPPVVHLVVEQDEVVDEPVAHRRRESVERVGGVIGAYTVIGGHPLGAGLYVGETLDHGGEHGHHELRARLGTARGGGLRERLAVQRINPADLRIDTYRASGAGGQHINKTDSAVRITHIPSGVVVECQEERSQHKNKAKAMALLASRLENAKRAAADAATSEMRRDLVGSGDRSERIRTYNYPQGRMTDHRINLTLYKLDAVMEGDLTELLDSLHREYQADQLAMLAQQNGG